jgi:hypothetical protein
MHIGQIAERVGVEVNARTAGVSSSLADASPGKTVAPQVDVRAVDMVADLTPRDREFLR